MSKVFKSINLFDYIKNKPVRTKKQVKLGKVFLEKARKVHGNRYDYSKVVYKNSPTKVTIICPIHGEFEQSPNKHLQGHGCYKCGIGFITTKEWIEKARKIHSDKYDYSKVVYRNRRTKVKIICPIHGEYKQKPNDHINGCGCMCCYQDNQKYTTEEFIKRSKLIHGDKYDYSLVDYINSQTKVKIICPIHGEFEQNPGNHINQKQGCPKCGGTTKLTTDIFINRSKLIHDDKYDYSLVEYKNNKTKVKIICPIHGEFLQIPHDHMDGHGCKICADIKKLEDSNYMSGVYVPKNPNKYDGNINNIIYRSSFELKAFEMVEYDKSILSWSSEEVVVPYELSGKQYKYYVDLKIITKNKTTLIEIKPHHKTIKPKYEYDVPEWNQNQAKWKAAREYCKERGWGFEIWTEKELGI